MIKNFAFSGCVLNYIANLLGKVKFAPDFYTYVFDTAGPIYYFVVNL